MPNRPTLKTIAQIAGLSHVAVSKALRDAPDISGATKERVKKIAEELGYTPNLAARNLYLQRTGAIGMMVPAMGDNTAYDLIFNEVSMAAAEQGYCVMLGSSHRNVELEVRHCRMMVGNQVGALIAAPCTSNVSHIKAACGPTPVIFIGGRVEPEEDYALLCDYHHSGELAVEHLTGLGHRDIALLTYGPENHAVTQKEEGFTLAMERRGLAPPRRPHGPRGRRHPRRSGRGGAAAGGRAAPHRPLVRQRLHGHRGHQDAEVPRPVHPRPGVGDGPRRPVRRPLAQHGADHHPHPHGGDRAGGGESGHRPHRAPQAVPAPAGVPLHSGGPKQHRAGPRRRVSRSGPAKRGCHHWRDSV